MTKLEESYTILSFLSKRISKTYKICDKYGAVSTKYQLVALELLKHFEFRDLGIKLDSEHKISNYISEQTLELKYLIDEAIAKSIIDMYSFYDEYNNYFTPNITDNPVFSEKIVIIKLKNKSLINSIDWKRIQKIRNIVLAHNIRNKKMNSEIAISSLKNYVKFSENILDCSKNFKVISDIFELIENEFKNELFPDE